MEEKGQNYGLITYILSLLFLKLYAVQGLFIKYKEPQVLYL